jgi:hypothetical protein
METDKIPVSGSPLPVRGEGKGVAGERSTTENAQGQGGKEVDSGVLEPCNVCGYAPGARPSFHGLLCSGCGVWCPYSHALYTKMRNHEREMVSGEKRDGDREREATSGREICRAGD